MVDVTKVSYKVIVVTSQNKHIDITNAVKSLGWEENEGQLAMKLSFELFNVKYAGSNISSIVKIGCLVAVKASWGSGKGIVAYCKIVEAETSQTGSENIYKVTAYDCLYDLQKSSDNVYYVSGKKTKNLLTDILASWSLKISKYTGPDVCHSAIVYKNKTLADIVLDILDLAKKKGGCQAVVRSVKGKIEIVRVGSNENVYCFNKDNSISNSHKVSTAELVTRVKIFSTIKNSEKTKLEETVNGNIKYGIRQKVISKSKSDKIGDAKKEAQTILNEKGKPTDTRSFVAPDVPEIRKGDKICYSFGKKDAYYIVKSVQHNADKCTMTMKAEKCK